MREIPEQQIAAMAPNANAINNARKIVKSGGFTEHLRSEDDTFYMGSCKGSGSSAYRVSLDFADGDVPVCRCSCPSRQFPCKHGLALMMELSQGRHWDICGIPQDILDKRAKKDARAGKKEDQGDKPKAPKKTNQAARTKKLKKQLEGLDLAEKVVRELMEAGLGTLSGTSAKIYQDLAKQLGDYYLPGPQRLVQSLVLEVKRLKEDGAGDYSEAVRILVFLRALIKKSRVYLTEKLEQGQVEDDNSVLYEELGGIWNLERLTELGLKKENRRLLQLSFHVSYEEARRELVDKGWWLDLDSGEINITYNYRPVKALKYVKEEDSVMEAVKVPLLVYYPGENGRRIRWEGQEFLPVTGELLAEARHKASASLPELVKAAKNELKNTLSDGRFGCLVSYDGLGYVRTEGAKGEQREYILYCGGSTIELKDRPGDMPSVSRLDILPDRQMAEHQVMFGVLWYDRRRQRICLHPYSIITEQEVVRLLY
ncbi:MAG: SWIM zinc finger family protein [Clostridia bacterium]|nr:SWIM zinc finger family protein [Clostridia bacterium]